MDIRAALKTQYHAAMNMLKQGIKRCPDDLWIGTGQLGDYWQIAYHTLFFTHLYLQPDVQSFRPWEFARNEYQFLYEVPWPPHNLPQIDQPYTKDEVLQYWALCDAMIDPAVDALDLDSPTSGFVWYKMPKLDHQLLNIRHIQHHAGQLDAHLRPAGAEIDWRA